MSLTPRSTPVRLVARAGYDEYAQAVDAPPRVVLAAVVSFKNAPAPTAPRAELSASRSRADIEAATAVLLFAPDERVAIGDRVDLFGVSLEVSSVFPRADVFGRLAAGHLEAALVRRET